MEQGEAKEEKTEREQPERGGKPKHVSPKDAETLTNVGKNKQERD